MNAVTRTEAWDQLVADPRPRDHIVQLYQEKAFLNRAVCRFVGAGLANGEGIILVSTGPHWTGFDAYLEKPLDVRKLAAVVAAAETGSPA